MGILFNEDSEWLTIRLTKAESEALTRIRIKHEMDSLKRKAVRHVLTSIIIDGAAELKLGKLNLPQFKTTPEIDSREFKYHISIEKTPEENTALKALGFTQNGTPVEYGQADRVRELIKLFDERVVGHIYSSFPQPLPSSN